MIVFTLEDGEKVKRLGVLREERLGLARAQEVLNAKIFDIYTEEEKIRRELRSSLSESLGADVRIVER